jgi:hypothetical protein
MRELNQRAEGDERATLEYGSLFLFIFLHGLYFSPNMEAIYSSQMSDDFNRIMRRCIQRELFIVSAAKHQIQHGGSLGWRCLVPSTVPLMRSVPCEQAPVVQQCSNVGHS